MTALTAKEVTTIPMRLVEAKYDLLKVSSRVENVFNTIPTTMAVSKIKGKKNSNQQQPIVTKLSKIQEKNARRKAMKNGGQITTKVKRNGFIADEKTLLFNLINSKIQINKKIPVLSSDETHAVKKQKIEI